MGDGDRAGGAAMRWRQRRLRAQWRHEQQSVAMAVAAPFHRSANKISLLEREVVEGTHSARQGQKTAAPSAAGSPAGARAARAPCGIVLGPWWCSFSGVAVAGGSRQRRFGQLRAPIPHCRCFEVEEKRGGGEEARRLKLQEDARLSSWRRSSKR